MWEWVEWNSITLMCRRIEWSAVQLENEITIPDWARNNNNSQDSSREQSIWSFYECRLAALIRLVHVQTCMLLFVIVSLSIAKYRLCLASPSSSSDEPGKSTSRLPCWLGLLALVACLSVCLCCLWVNQVCYWMKWWFRHAYDLQRRASVLLRVVRCTVGVLFAAVKYMQIIHSSFFPPFQFANGFNWMRKISDRHAHTQSQNIEPLTVANFQASHLISGWHLLST